MNAERVYRPLLRSYPAGYRAERGEEILDTVLEGGDRPRLREAWSLVFGGLRVRAAQNRRLPARTNWRLGVLLGVVSWLTIITVNSLVNLTEIVGHGQPYYAAPTSAQDWRAMAAAVLLLTTVVLTWFVRARWVAVTAVGAGVLLSIPGSPEINSWWILPILVACVLLARGPVRMPRLWLWVPGLLFTAQAVSVWGIRHAQAQYSGTALTITVVVLAVGWLVVDARPLLGLATFVFVDVGVSVLPGLFRGQADGPVWVLVVLPAIGLVMLAPAAWRLRRQSAL